MDSNKWDIRFLQLAQLVSTWSKDPSTQTGAVIVDENNRVISLGYNGLPRGVFDDERRLNDRGLKYEMIVHCEVNALLFAGQSVRGCTLYTYPFHSCSRCASIVIQAGIKRVVAPPLSGELEARWRTSVEISKAMFDEADVRVDEVEY